MFILKALSFVLIVCVAKSEMDFQTCKANFSYMNNTGMDVMKYCNNRLCIEKCCGDGEFFGRRNYCVNTRAFFENHTRFKHLYNQTHYNNINVYSWDGYYINKSKKNLEDNVFIRNQRDVFSCTFEYPPRPFHFIILEDGSAMLQQKKGFKLCTVIERLKYCIDFQLIPSKKQKPKIKLVIRQNYGTDISQANVKKITLFVTIACLVSSFFLLLVFVVYCLLPKLQNLNGLVLMAYIMCLFVAFILKVVMNLDNKTLTNTVCKRIDFYRVFLTFAALLNFAAFVVAGRLRCWKTEILLLTNIILVPMLYFTALSSFFWLSVMSFDTWRTLRGFRKRLDTNRRSKLVKFMWYCLYAWGCPLLITAVVTTLDNVDMMGLQDVPDNVLDDYMIDRCNLPRIVQPPFDDCMVEKPRVQAYFTIPVAVIVFVNIVLFSMTVYNIWMIKRAVHNHQDSRNSTKQTNRFRTYLNLSVIMGVSWFLEVIDNDMVWWLYILVNAYNLFTGVAIFFLFVFKKKILIMLCKRFNIGINLVKYLELSQHTRSTTTRTTKTSTVKSNSKDQNPELDGLKNCPKGEKEDA